MQYFGGKAKCAKEIAAVLATVKRPAYLEPFLGGGWVAAAVSHPHKFLFDANPALIAMWQALQTGWIPPDHVTEDEYQTARALPDTDPLKAFIGFGCSFGGKWFGGYARSTRESFAASAKRSLARKLPNLLHATIDCGLYQDRRPSGCLIYCDPPYRGTTDFAAVDTFDSEHFWETMRDWSTRNDVFVSEYAAPGDFDCVWQRAVRVHVNGRSRPPRIEKLFRYRAA